jgi:diacylglycerol kinase family enzyme
MPHDVVLLNSRASAFRSRGVHAQIEELFRSHRTNVVIRDITSPVEIPLVARTAREQNADVIVAGGGDGTVSAVASALAGGPTPLGILPLGTLNHFARDLRIPLDLNKAVATIVQGHVSKVDVGRVGDAIFVNNSSIGIYPSIIEIRERLRLQGHWKWTAFVKATIDVLRREDEVSISLESERTRIIAQTPFLFVGNNEYQGEGLHLGARSRLDGGRLYAYFAPPLRTRDLPRLFAHAVLGYARQEHTLESIAAEELWVNCPSAREMKLACDGELLTVKPPLHYRVWPGALNVITPPTD